MQHTITNLSTGSHIDSKLGGYGYSSDEVGYHWLQFDDSKQHSDTGIAFKKYQSDIFVDLALQRKDVPAALRPPPDEAFTPHPLFIENGWERVTILTPESPLVGRTSRRLTGTLGSTAAF